MLADRAGVTLQKPPRSRQTQPSRRRRTSPARRPARPVSDKRNRSTRPWPGPKQQYHECLLARRRGRAGPEVSPQERGITPESIGKFHLGFSPAGLGLDPAQRPAAPRQRAQMLEAIGVLARSAGGGSLYDRFRGRVLFSIRDRQGRPVGMGGRVLPESGSDQPGQVRQLARKRRCLPRASLLYGLDVARDDDPQEPHRAGDGGLHRLHRRPPVRLRQRGGRAGHGLGRGAHPHPQAIRRPDRAGARRRRGRASGGPTKCWSCSSPSRSICGSSRCPTRWTRASFSRSAAAEAFRELLDTERWTPWTMPFRGKTAGLDVQRDIHAVQPGPGAAAGDRGQGPAAAARHDRAPAGCASRRFWSNWRSQFRIDEAEVRRHLTAVRRQTRPGRVALAGRRRRPPATRPSAAGGEDRALRTRTAGDPAAPSRVCGRGPRRDSARAVRPPGVPADLRGLLPLAGRGHRRPRSSG